MVAHHKDTKQLENQLAKGITKLELVVLQTSINLKNNLVTWFKDLEKLRSTIMQRLPEVINEEEYELAKWLVNHGSSCTKCNS